MGTAHDGEVSGAQLFHLKGTFVGLNADVHLAESSTVGLGSVERPESQLGPITVRNRVTRQLAARIQHGLDAAHVCAHAANSTAIRASVSSTMPHNRVW